MTVQPTPGQSAVRFPNMTDSKTPNPPPALGRTVGRGVLWMIVNTGVAKLASFAAQVVLGALLSAHDFGVFAVSVSVAGLTSVFRDAGVRQLLVQRGREYEKVAGPLFWLGLTLNAAAAAALAVASPSLAKLYGEPQLTSLLLITAVAIPLATPGAMLSARLGIDLRFREISILQTVLAVIRYGGTIGCALAGAGPLSFVLPLPILAITEWIAGYVLTRSAIWMRSPQFSSWPEFFMPLKWSLLTIVAIILCNTGIYVVIGALVSSEVVGVYFFAYQLVIQIGAMLAGNVGQVLFPAFAKLKEEPTRQRDATVRALRMLMFVAAPMNLALVAVFAPLEALVWDGRWLGAVLPVVVISACYPAQLSLTVAMSVRQANGDFREWGRLFFLYGVGSILFGAVGAVVFGSAEGVAALSGGYMVVGATALTSIALGPSIPTRTVLRALMPAWAISSLVAFSILGFDALVLEDIRPVVRIVSCLTLFSALFTAASRLLLPNHLREALGLVPARLRDPVSKILRI